MFGKTILAVFATAFSVWGQANPEKPEISIFPPPPAAFAELKQHLGLSDAQLDQLRKILDDRLAATQEFYKQIQQKQTELNALLRSGSRDTNKIGQLTIDIHTLSTQPPPSSDQWRQRALAVLTAEQRTKLVPLDQALKLATPAYQATTLNLIDPPSPGRPTILGPFPTEPGPATQPAP